jgi:hypothetical protein
MRREPQIDWRSSSASLLQAHWSLGGRRRSPQAAMLKAAAVRDHAQRGHALPLHHEELSDGGRHARHPHVRCTGARLRFAAQLSARCNNCRTGEGGWRGVNLPTRRSSVHVAPRARAAVDAAARYPSTVRDRRTDSRLECSEPRAQSLRRIACAHRVPIAACAYSSCVRAHSTDGGG